MRGRISKTKVYIITITLYHAYRQHEEITDEHTEELIKMKRQSEADKVDLFSLKMGEEKLLSKLKDLEKELTATKSELSQATKQTDSQQKQLSLVNIENEGLRNQVSGLSKQYQSLLSENENIKNNLFDERQKVIEIQQSEASLKLNLEKYTREINHMNQVAHKSERNAQAT